MTTERCFQSAVISAPCWECKQSIAGTVHVVDAKLYCSEHCPDHSPATSEWEGEPVTVSGEQEGLF